MKPNPVQQTELCACCDLLKTSQLLRTISNPIIKRVNEGNNQEIFHCKSMEWRGFRFLTRFTHEPQLALVLEDVVPTCLPNKRMGNWIDNAWGTRGNRRWEAATWPENGRYTTFKTNWGGTLSHFLSWIVLDDKNDKRGAIQMTRNIYWKTHLVVFRL